MNSTLLVYCKILLVLSDSYNTCLLFSVNNLMKNVFSYWEENNKGYHHSITQCFEISDYSLLTLQRRVRELRVLFASRRPRRSARVSKLSLAIRALNCQCSFERQSSFGSWVCLNKIQVLVQYEQCSFLYCYRRLQREVQRRRRTSRVLPFGSVQPKE